MKNKILIGLIGTIGSGKTSISDYLSKKGYKRVVMGDLVREITKKEGLKLNRTNLLLTQKKYRTKFGSDYFIKLAVKRVKNAEKGLIDGIRTPIDATEAKKAGAIIVFIDANQRLRFERMKKRARIGFSKTFDEFKKEQKMEFKMLNFKKTLKYADYKLMNNGTKKEFLKKIGQLVKKIN